MDKHGSIGRKMADIGKRRWSAVLPPVAIALLVFTAAAALVRSYFQPLWSDELGVLYTDSVGSFTRVIQVQRSAPISLDPVFFHLLEHLSLVLLGKSIFALRLPSLLGYLVMQVCLFLFVHRAAGRRAGMVALLLSTLCGPVFYAAQARPYGVLLGLCGLIAVSWQTAAHASANEGARRLKALLLLGVSIAVALNTHYYAVLLLAPLYGAELFRSVQRRRLDVPVQLALVGGAAGLIFALPFVEAAARYKQHYYLHFYPNLHFITHSYLWLIAGETPGGQVIQRFLTLCLVMLAAIGLWLRKRRLGADMAPLPKADMVFLVLLAALPFFGYLMALKLKQPIEARFILCAVFGIAAVFGVGMAGFVRHRAVYGAIVAVLFLLTLSMERAVIATQIKAQRDLRLLMVLAPQTTAALAAHQGLPVYLSSPVDFYRAEFYADQAIRPRLAAVYSFPWEMHTSNSDGGSLTMSHLKPMLAADVRSYEEIEAQGGEHLFVLFPYSFDWLHAAFASDHAAVQGLGPAYGGELVLVRFPPRAASKAAMQ
jgi:hypothetical protein